MRLIWLDWSFSKVWDTAGNAWLMMSPSNLDVALVLEESDIKELNEEWKKAPRRPDHLRQE
jgi:hypothetical protein